MATDLPKIIDSRHPNWLSNYADWEKWRLCYRTGDEFRDRYLERFSTREDQTDFDTRKTITPIATHAKSAIAEIRNSIFQRMRDIVRLDGTRSYMEAINGLHGGVDRQGSTMDAFLGMQILEELLTMGRVGIYVDAPVVGPASTLADVSDTRPYLYRYAVEDILSWSCTKPDEPRKLQSLLLRDLCMNYDQRTRLPLYSFSRYRLYWLDDATGLVNLQFYDKDGQLVDQNGFPAGPIELRLRRIPFVMLDLGDSMLKDVCNHQIALLNLGSSDVNYVHKANVPFYVEQRDIRQMGSHLKTPVGEDGSSMSGGQGSATTEITVGTLHGRYYDLKAQRPAFIAPPTEPLEASLKLQDKLEGDIRKMVHLAVKNLATRASAESKSMDNQGLESGLSFIGLVLEQAERQVAELWAAYESSKQIATIKYPDRYSLKTDDDRISEAEKLAKLMNSIPGRTVKRELAKTMVTTLLSGKVDVDRLQTIHAEIDKSPFTTSDPRTIIDAKNAGLVGEQHASMALGFEDDEYLVAREDHTARILRIAEAQGQANPDAGDPGARGLDDLSDDPAGAGREEKAASRDNTLRDSTQPRVRGEGKANKE